MPPRNLILLFGSAIVSLLCYHTAARNHYGALLGNAIGQVNEHFVRPVNNRELYEAAMDGMLRRLDRYSGYISPADLAKFHEELDQKFGGIGIVVELNQDSKRLTVLSPLPDTPAAAAGMRAGDQILKIDGQDTEGFAIEDAVDLMRGDPGTPLELEIRHLGDEQTKTLQLHRAIIPIASVLGDERHPDGTWQFTITDQPRIGYVRLVSFGDKTAGELHSTLARIKPNIDGLILDLRGNGGGLLKSAVDVCDMFIDQGTIVSIRGRNRQDWVDHVASADTLLPKMPLVVLVDEYSASASEITAACLQDHKRATIVGERSWGKGTVQNVIPFEFYRSAIKLTIATYWRPSGQNIHRHEDAQDKDAWGVTPLPDHQVDVDDETRVKIMLWRRLQDKVLEDDPAAESQPSGDTTPEAEATPADDKTDNDTATDASSQDSDAATTLPDVSDFTDPQRQRALEVIRDLIEDARTDHTSVRPLQHAA